MMYNTYISLIADWCSGITLDSKSKNEGSIPSLAVPKGK